MKLSFSFLRSEIHLSVIYVDDCYLQGDSFIKSIEKFVKNLRHETCGPNKSRHYTSTLLNSQELNQGFLVFSEWKLTEGVFKQIVNTFSKPDNDLFASRINHPLSNYISWRPDPGAQALDAFSINCSPTYNYCFPPFSIILKVLQKIQQDKPQAIVVVPYWTTQNWLLVLLGMLVDHPLIMTASLNIVCLPTHPTTPHPLHPKLKLLVAHISGEISSYKLFLQ